MKILQITSLAVLLATVSTFPSQSAILVNETFADGTRTNQNPPDSLLWYSANSSSTLSTTVGAMTMTTDDNDNFVLGYLTEAASPFTLQVGQKMVLTVVFSGELSGAVSPTGLRFGLFNSHQSRISSTGASGSNAAYLNYSGYATAFGINSTQLVSNVWERNPGSGSNLINSSSAYIVPPTGTTVNGSLASNTPYTLTLELDYQSPTLLTVTSSLEGGGLSGVVVSTPDTTPVVAFDTIVLWGGINPFQNLTFSSVNLAVIPEPSTNSLLAFLGLALLTGGWLRQRRKANIVF